MAPPPMMTGLEEPDSQVLRRAGRGNEKAHGRWAWWDGKAPEYRESACGNRLALWGFSVDCPELARFLESAL